MILKQSPYLYKKYFQLFLRLLNYCDKQKDNLPLKLFIVPEMILTYKLLNNIYNTL